MHIGEMAERSGLSSRTLRHYESIGLIPPTGRTEGGYRLYTEEDLRRLMTIRRMKALSFSTAEMGELLALLDVIEAETGADTGAETGPEARADAEAAVIADATAETGTGVRTHTSLTEEQARARLLAMQSEARARREKLARQVERADEFLGILRDRLA
ncbi:MerR family transcriptional regulator [Brevibacterium album]|uniref:MerR family transcriptional regulator n=1 Tax=Brevibacterium album TaxID=417948 RepID=UPI00040A4B4E|nr:MerR family transcriptional regulator [Brevibacterium album]